jgi:SAM-dependent methyltransferase
MEENGIREMSAFLGEEVHAARPDRLPFEDGAFARVVVIDVHEHQIDLVPINREIARVTAPGGLAIVTTPNGDTRLPVAVLKRWIGMGPAEYGHVVQGYRFEELESMLRRFELKPQRRGAYSKFFTELVELAINFAYVKFLSRKKKGPDVPAGTIAPTSAEQLRAVERTYRIYSMIYPFVRAFSALDVLVPGSGGYAVAVAARKPS